jgi:hypothetical protein
MRLLNKEIKESLRKSPKNIYTQIQEPEIRQAKASFKDRVASANRMNN